MSQHHHLTLLGDVWWRRVPSSDSSIESRMLLEALEKKAARQNEKKKIYVIQLCGLTGINIGDGAAYQLLGGEPSRRMPQNLRTWRE